MVDITLEELQGYLPKSDGKKRDDADGEKEPCGGLRATCTLFNKELIRRLLQICFPPSDRLPPLLVHPFIFIVTYHKY